MRTIMTILTLAFILSLTGNAFTQDTESFDLNKNNYILLINKTSEIKPVCQVSAEMKEEDGSDFGVFQVVFIGKNIEDLVDKRQFAKHTERLKLAGIKFIACGYSLKKYDVNPEKLPEGVEIVENGISYSLKLKKKGFYGMEL